MLTRTIEDGLAQSEAPAYEQALNALWMHRVLPSQWLEELLTRRISDG
ncbi:hypothetical protein [Nonomuraea jabiensis]